MKEKTAPAIVAIAVVLWCSVSDLSAGGYVVNHDWSITVGGKRFGLVERSNAWEVPKVAHTTVYVAGKALRIHRRIEWVAAGAVAGGLVVVMLPLATHSLKRKRILADA